MKLLLDENPPKRLKGDLLPHSAFTVRDMGWNGQSNGALLTLLKENGFDALLTFDKNLAYQQNFRKYDVPLIMFDAADNTYGSIVTLLPLALSILKDDLQPGTHTVQARKQ